MPRPHYNDFFYSFFSKAWIIFIITIFIMVVFMSLFTKVLMYHLPAANQTFSSTFRRKYMKTFHWVNFYSLYIISIMTNQGKISNQLLFVNKQSKLDYYTILFRYKISCEPLTISDSCRYFFAGRNCISQLLFEYYRFVRDSTQDET